MFGGKENAVYTYVRAAVSLCQAEASSRAGIYEPGRLLSDTYLRIFAVGKGMEV